MHNARRQARWPYAIIVLFALIEPATHFWLKYGLSGGVAHSGFHIGDTPFFLTDMEVFSNGFYTPYLACASAESANNFWFFALPHHFLYASIGWVATQVHLDHFLALGIANGICAAFFLFMVLRFFRYVVPDRANLSFALFCLGGGLAGVVWLATWPLGLHEAPEFEGWFHRFARYELIEGPFLSPVLVLPRLYYTLPMGIGFAALMALIASAGREAPLPSKKAIALQFLCAYLNARIGLLFWGVSVCFMLAQPVSRPGAKWRYGLVYLIPTAVATMLMYAAFGMNTYGAINFAELLRRSAWFGSFITATFWAWPLLAFVFWRHWGQMGLGPRLIAGWAAGYGLAFAALYAAHQTWYGNWLAGGDTAAAIAVSDWALLGLIPGTAVALFRGKRVHPEESADTWISLWFVGLASLSIAAFGDGWFMRTMPERGLALLGPPLAMLLAEGIVALRARYPRLAAGYATVIIVSGVASAGVAALCFQGPLGHEPNRSAFGWAHSELVLEDDLALLGLLESGTVLAPASMPPLLGDVAVEHRPELKTIFGQPTLEFADVNMLRMGREVQHFFSVDATAEYRTLFVESWCVDFVYCPATRPVDPAVMIELKALPWLEPIATEGEAVLFRVLIATGASPDG